MAKLTIGLGIVLIALGVGGYFGTGAEHLTALIPAALGLPLLILGFVARKDAMRKHAMHAAAALGVAGFGGTVGGLFTLLTGGEVDQPVAVAVKATMALLCLAFVILCVGSFISARRAGAGPQES